MKIGWSVFRESPILKIGTFANTLIESIFRPKTVEKAKLWFETEKQNTTVKKEEHQLATPQSPIPIPWRLVDFPCHQVRHVSATMDTRGILMEHIHVAEPTMDTG